MTNDVLQVVIDNPIPQAALSFRDFLPSLVSAIIGALVGAGTAYVLYCSQRKREDRKAHQLQLDKKYDAGNKALFALFCQTHEMLDLKGLIKPYADDPERSRNLPVFEREYSSIPRINLDTLSFLLDVEMCPNVLRDLYLAQQSFDETTSMITRRELVRTEIAYQATSGNVNAFTKMKLEKYTDGLFDKVDQTYKKLGDIKEPLFECLKKIGYGMEPIQFVMIEGLKQ